MSDSDWAGDDGLAPASGWKVLGAWLVSVAFLACGASPPPPAEPSPTPKEPPPAEEAPADPPSESLPTEPRRSGDDPDVTHAILDEPAPPPTEPEFDVEVWAIRRGVEVDLQVDGCELAKLGNQPDDVLWCFHQLDRDDGLSVRYRSLHVVRGKKLVEVFRAPVAASLVRLEGETSGKPLVVLEVDVDTERKSVALRDDTDHSCDTALAEHADFVGTAAQGKARLALLKKVCAARGRYRFTGTALRRVGR